MAPGAPDQIVLFRLGEENFGVSISLVREVTVLQPITRVPRTPDFIEGVTNLRGRVIPVLDLRRRLGLPADPPGREARIVVVEYQGEIIGMIVDGVSEVLTIDPASVEPPSPYVVSVDTQYITGILKLADRLVILLDLTRVLSAEEAADLGEFNATTASQMLPKA
ncbi:MAG: chemotaxis protein CheW [Limnochordales bacterium]|nr:chemotaxis protein CheW [Limnochordales bacterium]